MTQEPHPLRVAIIGSGAAGFFCADYLLRLAQPCEVCMFEQNPTPFGLVRDGVAPDKSNIRSVTRAFDRIAVKKGFSWFGNVTVGRDISITTLKNFFHAVIVAGGASNPKKLDIQGESLQGCFNARSFAGWYNGSLTDNIIHPDLSHPAAVVIGAGNAALDMVRILAAPPESLENTDIASRALATLRKSGITDIHLVSRRGPIQARFASEELLALAAIPGCSIKIHSDTDFEQSASGSEELLRLQEAYRKLVKMPACTTQSDKRIHLHFNLTPFSIMGINRVEGVLFMDTHETAMYIPCGLAITSIGFMGQPITGLPFDEETGVIPNRAGRVTDNGNVIPGMYVAGWIKRGAIGVIGSNKPCCRETVQIILDDRTSLCHENALEVKELTAFLKQNAVQYLTYSDWLKIDAAEQERGVTLGKVREKFPTLSEILSLLP
jgi:NADPH-dependent glutamate synthase beta subunit-like oxidoreductase